MFRGVSYNKSWCYDYDYYFYLKDLFHPFLLFISSFFFLFLARCSIDIPLRGWGCVTFQYMLIYVVNSGSFVTFNSLIGLRVLNIINISVDLSCVNY